MQEFITMHEKFLKVYLACRSAHIWEKQICLKIQQRQRNAEWFFQLEKVLKFFSVSAGGSVKSNS